ncbi:MAG: helix-turn-helix transcriptional regulator [Dehalococcoidia bacterium]
MDLDELTAREREIFALAASGVANADIADELGITENAVRYHLKEIHSKLETGGQRSFLRWHRLRALVPSGLLGSRAASAVATSTVFGVAGVLAVGAVLARPGDEEDATGPDDCPTAYGSWPGSTFEDFASIGQKPVEEIRALNPGLTEAELAAGSVEVNVGERENAQCVELVPTTPAEATTVGGTPQATP